MNVMDIYYFVVENWTSIVQVVVQVIGIASIVVKLTPTLKDDTVLKKIVKFIGKFIALNNTISAEKQKIANKKGIAF